MVLKQHPLAAAFPAMTADDFAVLVDDIKVNGQREPVIVFEGMVLDGWHRYSACLQLGLEAERFTFGFGKDPVAFVLSQNLHRRHLSASQRAAAIVACTEWAPAHRSNKVEPSSTLSKNEDLAKAAGVTPRTITDAKAAHKAGLTDAVKDGAMTVKEAAQVARGAPQKTESPKSAPPAATLEQFGPSAEELADAEREQAAEFAALRLLLDADDKLAAAAAEVKRLTALSMVLQSRVDGLMNEKNEAIAAAKSWKRKFEKTSREGTPA
jgi:hypothetical protein